MLVIPVLLMYAWMLQKMFFKYFDFIGTYIEDMHEYYNEIPFNLKTD